MRINSKLLLRILVAIAIILLISLILIYTLGLISFLGTCFLLGAGYVLIVRKGKVPIAPNSPFVICIALGLVFLVASHVFGFEMYTEEFASIRLSLMQFYGV